MNRRLKNITDMLFSLSTAVIADTVRATAACRILSAPDDEKTIFDPLMRSETRGRLGIMVKNAFAEIVLSLFPHVTDCDLDGETASAGPGGQDAADDPDMLLSLELPAVSASGAVIRRHLEQAVAMRTLSSWCLAAEDTARAGAYEALASASVSSVLSSLTPAVRPFLLPMV